MVQSSIMYESLLQPFFDNAQKIQASKYLKQQQH